MTRMKRKQCARQEKVRTKIEYEAESRQIMKGTDGIRIRPRVAAYQVPSIRGACRGSVEVSSAIDGGTTLT